MTPRKILVGYDGSSDARRAGRWALDEAARTQAPVEFCYAYNWPAYVPAGAMMPASAVWPDGDTDQAITDMVEGVALSAAETHPTVTVSTVITRTPAVPTLTERSAGAGLIVLGSRGHSAVAGLLGGSVTIDVSSRAHCPVVVVRGKTADNDPVVVGVDDSPYAETALAFAARQAAGRGVALRVIRAWLPPATGWNGSRAVIETVSATERHSLDTLLRHWRQEFPALAVTIEVSLDDAGRVLTEAGFDAQLVVVGSRGRGPFRGALLGSVSQHLLHHCACSVAIVRGPGQET